MTLNIAPEFSIGFESTKREKAPAYSGIRAEAGAKFSSRGRAAVIGLEVNPYVYGSIATAKSHTSKDQYVQGSVGGGFRVGPDIFIALNKSRETGIHLTPFGQLDIGKAMGMIPIESYDGVNPLAMDCFAGGGIKATADWNLFQVGVMGYFVEGLTTSQIVSGVSPAFDEVSRGYRVGALGCLGINLSGFAKSAKQVEAEPPPRTDKATSPVFLQEPTFTNLTPTETAPTKAVTTDQTQTPPVPSSTSESPQPVIGSETAVDEATPSTITSGVGLLIGTKGTKIGEDKSQPNLGGEGTSQGLGGLGTKGRGMSFSLGEVDENKTNLTNPSKTLEKPEVSNAVPTETAPTKAVTADQTQTPPVPSSTRESPQPVIGSETVVDEVTPSTITSGVGLLIGTKGTKIGEDKSQPNLGGEGTSQGLGGLGTKGQGSQ